MSSELILYTLQGLLGRPIRDEEVIGWKKESGCLFLSRLLRIRDSERSFVVAKTKHAEATDYTKSIAKTMSGDGTSIC